MSAKNRKDRTRLDAAKFSGSTRNVATANHDVGPLSRLYVITPNQPAELHLPTIEHLTNNTDVMVQLRYKSTDEYSLRRSAEQALSLCRAAGRRCIINDRVDLAQKLGADGVHLGAQDTPVTLARESFDGLIGATCRNLHQAQTAMAAGADYLGVGPIFATSSKTELPEPLGTRHLKTITDAVDIPVYAIGGITADSVPQLRAAGAYGVAVISAVFGHSANSAATPEAALASATQLAQALYEKPAVS